MMTFLPRRIALFRLFPTIGFQIIIEARSTEDLPGLENNNAYVQLCRNSYEHEQGVRDLIIPKGFVAEFDAEFFSSKTDGYFAVEKEADVFQTLVKLKPSYKKESIGNNEEKEDTYDLDVFVHFKDIIMEGFKKFKRKRKC
jgi:hypothetical protein